MDGLVGLVEQVITSPWLYLLVVLVVAVDGLFPVVPGEAVVITAGVFASTGEPPFLALVAAASVGAVAGDYAAYTVGRGVRRMRERVHRHRRADHRFDWVERLRRHGGWLLVAARFVPGGRTVTTVAAGVVRFPVRQFALFAGLAAVAWAVYAGLLGYWGSVVFRDQSGKATLFGIALGVALGVVAEGVRRLFARRAARRRAYDEASTSPACATSGDGAHEPTPR